MTNYIVKNRKGKVIGAAALDWQHNLSIILTRPANYIELWTNSKTLVFTYEPANMPMTDVGINILKISVENV